MKNVRVDPHVTLTTKSGTTKYVANETPVENRQPILDAYKLKAGKIVEAYFRKLPDPADHPVFTLTPGTCQRLTRLAVGHLRGGRFCSVEVGREQPTGHPSAAVGLGPELNARQTGETLGHVAIEARGSDVVDNPVLRNHLT